MLTRDMLRYRVQRGEVRPRFIDATDPTLCAFADDLLQHVQQAASKGETRGAVEEGLPDGADRVELPIARGLRKLVLDLCHFAPADPDASLLRAEAFARSTAVLRALPAGATRDEFLARLAEACGDTSGLYGDLPCERRLLEVKPLGATDLLHRYNMAQVQGLVLGCKSLHVRVGAGHLRALRRVLRWLKFCRLVARVQQHEDGVWDMHITGPAEIFDNAKKYGFALALFVPVVPVLDNYQLNAEVLLRPGCVWHLALSQQAPLVSPHKKRLGCTPDELQHVVKTFADPEWVIDTRPGPRSVGAKDMMLPDFSCIRVDGRRVDVELFHRWHRHALGARIEQLQRRPDPDVLLGIDRALLTREGAAAALKTLPDTQTFIFHAFPTSKKLRESLVALPPSVQFSTDPGT